jgi:SH3 domain protein
MRKTIVFVTTLFCLLGVAMEGHGGSTAYVTDSFEITVRTGPSTDNKIIYMPQSAQPLEVLDVQGDWSRVRVMRKGGEPVEGWTLSRYLISRLPWELKVKSLSEENSSLKERLSALQKSYDAVSQREKELAANLQENNRAFQALRTEHDSLKSGATEYLKLKSEHKDARSKLETLQQTIDELTAENRQLESSQRNRWFATGALVLLCGLLIGVAVGRQYRKKRSSYY